MGGVSVHDVLDMPQSAEFQKPWQRPEESGAIDKANKTVSYNIVKGNVHGRLLTSCGSAGVKRASACHSLVTESYWLVILTTRPQAC